MTETDAKAGDKPSKGASIYVNAGTMTLVDEIVEEQGASRTTVVGDLLDRALTSAPVTPPVPMSPHMVALHELAALDDVTPMLRAMLHGEVGDTASFGPVLMRLKMLTAALETI